jgi:hypothetical protein
LSNLDYPNLIPTPAGHILTSAKFGQLGIFLSETICFDEALQLKHHYVPRVSPIKIATFVKDMTKCSNVLLFMSGTAKSDAHPVILGGWFPDLAQDRVKTQPQQEDNWEGHLLFQLAPVHHIFHGAVGKPAWHLSDGDICFGEMGMGMTMAIADSLRTATVNHTTSEVVGADCLYGAIPWSGEWCDQIEVEHVELWSCE